MDEKALQIVRDYIFAHLDKTDTVPPFDDLTKEEIESLK